MAKEEPVPVPVEKVIEKKVVKKVQVKKKREFFPAPSRVKGVIERISSETGVPYEAIEKIMFCESEYDPEAKHVNKNGSIDRGIMQVNSTHDQETKKLGLDMYDPDDNATFSIILINRKINRGRPALEDWVCTR